MAKKTYTATTNINHNGVWIADASDADFEEKDVAHLVKTGDLVEKPKAEAKKV